MYTAVARQRGNKADEMMKFFHIIGWGLPLVIVSVALGLGKLGQDHVDSAGWCWIDGRLKKGEKEIWMLFTGKAWEITAYFLCSIFYLMLKCRIRKEVSEGSLCISKTGKVLSIILDWGCGLPHCA